MNWLNKIKLFSKPKVLVLMYHRVADVSVDPWQLAVSPVNFEQQLQLLIKKYNLISTAQLTFYLQNKSIQSNQSNSICLTFDDGYSDNYLLAKPLLEKFGCPATFFITNHYIDQDQYIGSDELVNVLLLTAKLPPSLSLYINEELFVFELGDESILTREQWWNQKNWIWPNKPATKRCELYIALWERLKPLPYEELQLVLKEIRRWACSIKSKNVGDESHPMTIEQIKNLAEHPLFTIGLHTSTHPYLSYHSKAVQLKEIENNKSWLEERCNKRMNIMAYPYGDYNDVTISVVKNIRLDAAFTTEEEAVHNHSNPYCLGRYQVKNWNGEELECQLRNWFKQ